MLNSSFPVPKQQQEQEQQEHTQSYSQNKMTIDRCSIVEVCFYGSLSIRDKQTIPISTEVNSKYRG